MKTNTVCLFLFGSLLSISGMAQPGKDSTQVKKKLYYRRSRSYRNTERDGYSSPSHDYFSSRKATNREKI